MVIQMDEITRLEKEIEKTTEILQQSQQNLESNPDQYSAQLLVMSTENHLVDLLKKLDREKNA